MFDNRELKSLFSPERIQECLRAPPRVNVTRKLRPRKGRAKLRLSRERQQTSSLQIGAAGALPPRDRSSLPHSVVATTVLPRMEVSQ